MVLGCHVEVAGLGRVVGGLFGDIVAVCLVWEFPIAGESFAQDWVQWFLDSSASSLVLAPPKHPAEDLRGLDVPTTQVEFNH